MERPRLREVALGGPDTATRARTIWQLRLADAAAGATCADVASWVPDGGGSTGRLRARAKASDTTAQPCVVPATAVSGWGVSVGAATCVVKKALRDWPPSSRTTTWLATGPGVAKVWVA